jgi:hypothetical protein
MKKLLLGSLVLLMFSASIVVFNISCNKESDAQQTSNNCIGPQPKVQFNANGKTYNGDYKFDQRLGWFIDFDETPSSIMIFNNSMQFTVVTSNVYSQMRFTFPNITEPTAGTTYTYLVKPGTCYFDNTNGSSENGGTISLTFTRVSGGTADGTFSGAISYTSPLNQTITITNGAFSNIPVFNY